MAGYAFARGDFIGKKVIFALFLGILMMPETALIVPQFIVLSRLHLVNTYTALIGPWFASIFGTFLMRQQYIEHPARLRRRRHHRRRQSLADLLVGAAAHGQAGHGYAGRAALYGQLELLYLPDDRYLQGPPAYPDGGPGHGGAGGRRCRSGYVGRRARLSAHFSPLCHHAEIYHPGHLFERR